MTPTINRELLNTITGKIISSVTPLRVIVFGSAASGTLSANSDVDILVVMPEGIHRRRTAQILYKALNGTGVAKDIIVVTEKDIRDHGADPSLIIHAALQNGKELYRAA